MIQQRYRRRPKSGTATALKMQIFTKARGDWIAEALGKQLPIVPYPPQSVKKASTPKLFYICLLCIFIYHISLEDFNAAWVASQLSGQGLTTSHLFYPACSPHSIFIPQRSLTQAGRQPSALWIHENTLFHLHLASTVPSFKKFLSFGLIASPIP